MKATASGSWRATRPTLSDDRCAGEVSLFLPTFKFMEQTVVLPNKATNWRIINVTDTQTSKKGQIMGTFSDVISRTLDSIERNRRNNCQERALIELWVLGRNSFE